MVSRKTIIASLAAAATLGSAVPAAAAIPLDQARAVAAKAGRVAARQTHASSSKVVSCKRTGSRRALCKVKLRYSSGARTCMQDVNVTLKSRSSSKLVYSFGQTICS
jgi:hypothetical protein